MKIHAFKVNKEDKTADLVDVLKLVHAEDKLVKRIRLINRAELRIDSIEFRDGVWLLDFVKFRQTQGPGRGKKKQRLKDLSSSEAKALRKKPLHSTILLLIICWFSIITLAFEQVLSLSI